jgi:hypothetical protein
MSVRLRDSQWDRKGIIEGMLRDIPIPPMARIRQIFPDNGIKDIPAAVRAELARPEIRACVPKGARIAITVGSRGIANLSVLVRSLVQEVRAAGGEPFVVPAMASHGGATAEGQREILAGMDVTEEAVGAPIEASMDTVAIGETRDGKTVHLDRVAWEADGIIVFGRVKPHTAFRGPHESGLYKMMAIGMGNQVGAEQVHGEGFGKMAHNVPAYAEVVMAKARILFGVAVVENAFDDTCRVEAVVPDRITERDAALLKEARDLMPTIKLETMDVLVIDQLGKNFSGDGIDPNISGAYITPYASGGPQVQRYVVLDVSDESHGNVLGAGVCHFSTKRLFDKADFDAYYPNALTSRVVLGARIPLILANDRLAFQAALYTCVDHDPANPRVVRIPNTSHIGEIMISEAMVPEARDRDDIEILEEPRPLPFDEQGNLF